MAKPTLLFALFAVSISLCPVDAALSYDQMWNIGNFLLDNVLAAVDIEYSRRDSAATTAMLEEIMDMITVTQKGVAEIIPAVDLLDLEVHLTDTKLEIEGQYETLKFYNNQELDLDSEEYIDWANGVHNGEGCVASALNSLSLLITHNGLIEKVKSYSEAVIDNNEINQISVARSIEEFFKSQMALQVMGYSLLFIANNILEKPKKNDLIYKRMVQRLDGQMAKVDEGISSLPESYAIKNKAFFEDYVSLYKDVSYLHIEDLEADEGKVITGFKLFKYHGNRLALAIKQGTLKEYGIIEELGTDDDWKYPSTWDQKGTQNYYEIKDYGKISKINIGNVQADAGKSIVGIKFKWIYNTIKTMRIELQAKVADVDVTTGTIHSGNWIEKDEGSDYFLLSDIGYVCTQEVVTNPPSMLTGVALYQKGNRMAISANDVFEDTSNDESKNSCWLYENVRKHGDIGCCDGYIYDQHKQVCPYDNGGPDFVECHAETGTSKESLECANGHTTAPLSDGSVDWDGCLNNGSVRLRCPKGQYPCNLLRDNKKEFICDETCETKGGKRTCSEELQCYGVPSTSKQLVCDNGKMGYDTDRWNGCVDRGSVRVRCPKGHYPCNALTDKGNEFKCGTTCEKQDGKRECKLKELECHTEPSTSNQLECANGHIMAPLSDGSVDWNGCIHEGSVRVRCPKGHYPCNELRDNGKEFKCGETCEKYGGKRSCKCAVLYEHADYTGDSFILYSDNPVSDLVEIGWNDRISSIRVSEDYVVEAYEHKNQEGEKKLETPDDNSHISKNDWISSLSCQKKCAVLYENEDYTGDSFNLYFNNPVSDLGEFGWNDRISSIRVSTDYVVEAYEHKDHKGKLLKYTHDKSDMWGGKYDDWISSLSCKLQ